MAELICGGVWVDAERAFVPVRPKPPYTDAEMVGSVIVEYERYDPAKPAATDGDVRACLLLVPPEGTSPTWQIVTDAGGGAYYEYHSTACGSGSFRQTYAQYGQDGEYKERYTALPHGPGGLPLEVMPLGERFQVDAGPLGVGVLATFCEVPFQLEYERRDPNYIWCSNPRV
ncbi:MAG TPA: hypothetical protein VKQ34_02515 [Candidatus Saccharimonadales bacterium]|nr:hypothetical protein [Candidatus Saccharimonadales bacterium]